MRNQTISLLLFMLLPLAAGAEEAKVASVSGNVEVRQGREGQWVPATDNMEIAEGGAIRTGADGAAVLFMPNKTKVWLKETTTLELEQRQTMASRLALVFGKIKLRVPHLMRKEKFEVRTPAAVCAVRGTEFTLDTSEDGKMNLQVLFGEVKLKFTVPQAKGKSEFNIPQGQGLNVEDNTKAVKPALLDATKERSALENWAPGLKPEERQKELKAKENDRAQVKEFAKATNNAEKAAKGFLNVVKESDLEAGRTMSDIHGNVVRVDQRMVRPNDNTIQFVNLVKRTNYANFTGREFAYNGGAQASRLDMMQMNMGFDAPLPQRIEEWPSFFKDSTINPVYASFVTANRTNKDEIFVIAEGFRYDATNDEMMDNIRLVNPSGTVAINASTDKHAIITGILADDGTPGKAQEMLNAISRLQIKDTSLNGSGQSTNGGRLEYKDATGTYTPMTGANTDVLWAMNMSPASGVSSWSTSGDPLMYQYQADPYKVGNVGGALATNIIFYARENYMINNGGQIQRTTDFTESSMDPFSILKNSGAETIAYIKTSNGNFLNGMGVGTNGWANATAIRADINDADRFNYSAKYDSKSPNIDAVFIPDLFLAAVQRMLPAITGSSSNNN